MTAGVTAGGRFRSWADIQANAARAAGGFQALGVSEDDSVALMLRNDFATFEVNMAAGQLGAYAVPINWHFTPEEAGYILVDCAAKVLVAHSDLLAQIAPGIPPGVRVLVVPTPEEIAAAYNVPTEKRTLAGVETWDAFVARGTPNTQPPKASRGSMIYTSGTTGRPKGVRRQPSSPEMQAAAAQEVTRYWGLLADPSIVVLMNGPMYHSAPAAYGMSSARLGLPIVLQPRFDAADMLRLIEKHRVSHMHIVPTMFVRLLRLPDAVKRRHDLSSLRWITHGAAPCAPAVKRQMIDWWGPVINEYYGATETGIVVWHDSQEALSKPGTVGHVVPGATLRIVDEEGRDVGPGEVGEIYLRGPHLSEFTYNNDDAKRREVALGDLVTVGDGRLPGRRRLHLSVRSQARHDHLGRRQHLSGRNRIGADPDAGRARLRSVRHPRRGVWRADLCLCRAAGRCHPGGAGCPRLPRRAPGALQGAEGGRVHRRPAA
jgi:long-chain acyl-CoA synthetase